MTKADLYHHVGMYAIAWMEMPIHSDGASKENTRYHTALGLAIMEHASPVKILQQLHYNNLYYDDEYCIVVPEVRDWDLSMIQKKDGKKHTHIYVAGSDVEILPRWNHALHFAEYVRDGEFYFDVEDMHLPHARNCRNGAMATIKSIGLEFREDFAASSSGTLASRFPVPNIYEPASHVDITEQWSTNAKLLKALPSLVSRPKEIINQPSVSSPGCHEPAIPL